MPKMDVFTLKAILQSEKLDALGVNTSQLASERAKALDYYYGNMTGDMPNQDGRSSAVSTDVADVVEGLMPGLMEIFASTEEPVQFNPVGPEDVDAAEQETDYVNHIFMQKNRGFLTLYSFIKDALLSKVGIVKVAWETTERESTETYYNLGEDELAVMLQDPGIEVTKKTEHDDGYGNKSYDVELTLSKQYGCAKVYPVPPEEFGISKRARTLTDCAYCYHEPAGITESDLIRQGYDEFQVRSLPTNADAPRIEAISRDTIEVGSRAQTAADEVNRPMRPIRVTEHYIRMDYEGSGKVKLYRVTTGSDQFEVLTRNGVPDVVEVDTMPFACMTPVIVTHRFFGRSIADLVVDIQKIKTALYRALLDNMYLANNQRIAVDTTTAHERTLDDLLVNRPGGIVRVKSPNTLFPLPSQSIGNFAFPLIEYVDTVKEMRTGVSLQSQGLNANALQNQSATAVNQAFTATQAKMKLIARIFAETGIRDLFYLLHATIRKNDRKQNTVRLRNKWVTVDPRNWKERDDLTITVGLGSGSKELQIAQLMQVLNVQKEMMMGGLPTVTPKNVYNTAAKLVEKVDLKNPEPYFTDPDSPQGQQLVQQKQQQPNPDMAKVQGQLQIQAAQAQGDLAAQQARMQADMAMEQQKFEHQRQLEALRAQNDQEIARIRAEHDHQINIAKVQSAHQAHLADIESKGRVAAMKNGGELGPVLQPVVEELGKHIANVHGSLQQLAQMTHDTMKVAAAPRKSQLVRDKKGKASHAISTIVTE